MQLDALCNFKWQLMLEQTEKGTNLDLEDDDITDELLPKPRLKKNFKG